MQTARKLSEKDKKRLKERALAGESSSKLAEEYGVDVSTVNYHKRRALTASQQSSSRKEKIIKRKKPQFLEIPLNTPKVGKVMIVVTEASNVSQVMGELWK